MRGDTTNSADLERAGIPDAAAAIICPSDATNEADMRSILTVLAIETMAPKVRTVVEVNNPKHVEHVRRAHADEILVTSQLASRLLARTALYPGPGRARHRHRVGRRRAPSSTGSSLPDDYADLGIDDLSARLRREHNATLLAVTRDGRTLDQPARRTSGSPAATPPSSWPRAWVDLHPLEPDDALDMAD